MPGRSVGGKDRSGQTSDGAVAKPTKPTVVARSFVNACAPSPAVTASASRRTDGSCGEAAAAPENGTGDGAGAEAEHDATPAPSAVERIPEEAYDTGDAEYTLENACATLHAWTVAKTQSLDKQAAASARVALDVVSSCNHELAVRAGFPSVVFAEVEAHKEDEDREVYLNFMTAMSALAENEAALQVFVDLGCAGKLLDHVPVLFEPEHCVGKYDCTAVSIICRILERHQEHLQELRDVQDVLGKMEQAVEYDARSVYGTRPYTAACILMQLKEMSPWGRPITRSQARQGEANSVVLEI